MARAVVTVPAYFSRAQREATRMAATLAGLQEVSILSEPVAASLAYGLGGSTGTVRVRVRVRVRVMVRVRVNRLGLG